MILNLTRAEAVALRSYTVPESVARKASGLLVREHEQQIEGQMDIDAVLAAMHAPGKEESDAAYERR